MVKVRPWCGQPSDRGRLKIRSDLSITLFPALNSSAGTHQDLWLCGLLSDGWYEQPLNEVVEALAPNTLAQFLSLPHHSTSLHNNLSTCLRFVQLQSNFHQSQLLTGYLADVARTFESFI